VTARGDFLVIGSGIAGLRAAITLAETGRVVILTKADPRESNTGYAQGGIAVAVGDDDSPELHARDTVEAGDGLCRPDAVDVLVRDGPARVGELIEWGAVFDRDADGRLALAREAAHSVRRVLHARDATGREISRTLWQTVSNHPRVQVLQDAQATALLVQGNRCTGATFVGPDGLSNRVDAPRTLIATGGAGQVFRETTNPAVATGDGIAMAFEAGARVADLEFVQFHPTVLAVAKRPRFLLSEALRGEGAWLVNDAGERFVTRDEPGGELAPRDVVARAIAREMQRTGRPVYLTLAHLDPQFVRRRFPTIAEVCARAGLDLAIDPIPVSPAAHYVMGGVETDLHGRTSIEGLFAAGEVACTGVHGANRLASNSLLEGLVFGARAAAAMRGDPQAPRLFAALDQTPFPAPGPVSSPPPDEQAVRELMWRDVGLIRTRAGLESAVTCLGAWHRACAAAGQPADGRADVRRLASLVAVGLLIARAALRRAESRGGHFRADFPSRDDLHLRHHLSDARPDAAHVPS
jgi:L-aspartate oxidase